MSTRTFVLPVVAAGSVPTWASNLSPRQVTTLSASNGVNTFYSLLGTLPAPLNQWQSLAPGDSGSNSPSFAANAVFEAWGGGRGDTTGKRLFIHGGGHGDSANNGLYYYDLNGSTNPTGWVYCPNSLSLPSVPGYSGGNPTYSDGKPTSVHTWDALAYANNRFYRCGGGSYRGPAGALGAFYYDLTTQQWSSTKVCANPNENATIFVSPDGSKLLYAVRQYAGVFYDSSLNVLGTGAASPIVGNGGWQTSTPLNRDTLADRWLVVGQDDAGRHIYHVSIDWTANSITWGTNQFNATTHAAFPSATVPNVGYGGSGPCLSYDQSFTDAANGGANAGPVVWMFGFAADCTGGVVSRNLYRLKVGAPWTMTVEQLSSTFPAVTKSGMNRHVWFPDWRVIVTAQHYNSAPVAFKVPT